MATDTLSLEDKRRLASLLKRMAQWLKGSPNFSDRAVLRDWGNELMPYWGEELITTMGNAHFRWDFWPSFREIIQAAGFEALTPEAEIEKAVISIWGHLENNHDLTILGGQIFDSLGGWQKIGAVQMDSYSKRHWEKRFWDMGKRIQQKAKEEPTDSPQLPEAPQTEAEADTESMEKYLKAKEDETHRAIMMPRLAEKIPYSERKKQALAQGKTYWEPPRSWELEEERDLTAEERKLWMEKLQFEIKKAKECMCGEYSNSHREDSKSEYRAS